MATRVGRPIVRSMVKAKGVIPDVQTTQNASESTNNICVGFGNSADVSDAGPLAPIVEVATPEPVEPAVRSTESELRSAETVVPVEELQPKPPTSRIQRQSQVVESSLELHEIESWDENPRLKRSKARNLREAEFTIDVAFLRHVIQTLITRHEITITSQDVHDIMAFFGDCEIRTSKRKVVERGVDGGCLCFSAKDTERIIEVVKKVLVLGVNIAKYCPDLMAFLNELGITL
jgi:hypothetical protein